MPHADIFKNIVENEKKVGKESKRITKKKKEYKKMGRE